MLPLDVPPYHLATTSAGPGEEGLLAARAHVGVNAHIATREVWRVGISATSTVRNVIQKLAPGCTVLLASRALQLAVPS